jgi:lactoylglutathione lyase
MTLEHVAIWTSDTDRLKDFYVKFFNGVANNKYINTQKEFESYFLSFKSGARLEIMKMKGVPDNLNDTIQKQDFLYSAVHGKQETDIMNLKHWILIITV